MEEMLLEIKDLSVEYQTDDATIYAVNHVDLAMKKGQTLGIVGHTGAGKSTLANLMTRLYDPIEGRITLDGEDLKNYSLEQQSRGLYGLIC